MNCDDSEIRGSNYDFDSNSLVYTDNDQSAFLANNKQEKKKTPKKPEKKSKVDNEKNYATNPYFSSPETKGKPVQRPQDEVEINAKERVKGFLTKYAEEDDPVKQEATEVIMLLMKFYQVHISKLGELVVKKEEEAKYFENQAADALEKLLVAQEEKEQVIQANQEKLESVDNELNEAKRTIVLLDEEVLDYRKLLQEKEKRIEEVEAEKQHAIAMAESNQKEISMENERTMPRNSVNEEAQLQLESLERKLESSFKENTRLLEQLERRDKEINQLDNKVHSGHSRILLLEEDLNQAKNELFETKMKVLEAKNVKRENEVLLQELHSCKAANAKLQATLEVTIEELSDAKFQLLQTESCSHSPPSNIPQNFPERRKHEETQQKENDQYDWRRTDPPQKRTQRQFLEEEKDIFSERRGMNSGIGEGVYNQQRQKMENRRSFGGDPPFEDNPSIQIEPSNVTKSARATAVRTPPPNLSQKRKPLKRFDDSFVGSSAGDSDNRLKNQNSLERNQANRQTKLWNDDFDGLGRPQDVSLMPSDSRKEAAAQSTKHLETELASLNESRRNYELRLARLPGNPKKAKDRELKEQLEDEVEKVTAQINSVRLKMKKLHAF